MSVKFISGILLKLIQSRRINMPKKKSRTVSFDVVVKSFIRNYNIPTKRDIDRLIDKMDRLEKLIRKTNTSLTFPGKGAIPKNGSLLKEKVDGRGAMTASAIVLDIISSSRKGADFAHIQDKTGFDDKKIRNIIFRLNKIGKIKRKNRGIYMIEN